MMVPFQLSTLPVTPWKNGGGETREIICVPAPDAPFLWRASIATLQADGPFSPFLASTGSLLCWRGSRYGCVARISTNRWRSGSRGLSPANGRCPASGSLRQGWTSISCLSAGARRRQFRSLATCNALPARGSLMFYKASGIWPGDAARPAAASAGAVDPRGICVPWAAMDACCWRRSRSNNRQER